MSQVFAADGVSASNVGIPAASETTVVTGNFVNPPFGNAKAIVTAAAYFQVPTGTTNIVPNIRRNPTKENVILAGTGGGISATVGNLVYVTALGIDVIPDGRAVQYALTITTTGASGSTTANTVAISVLLISG